MGTDSYLRSIALGIGILAAIAVGWVLSAAEALLVPVVIGALLAFLMDGVSREMARLPLYARIVPPWARLTMTSIVLFLILMLGIGFFARNLEAVVRALPQYVETFTVIAADVARQFDVEVELTWNSVNKIVSDSINLQDALRYVLNSLSYSAGYVALVFLYAILFLFEKNAVDGKIAAIFPDEDRRAGVWVTIDAIISQIGTYFTMKTLVNVVLGAICYVIFLLFGVEFAAFFAVLTAIFNYIPYVGSWIAMVLPMLFALGQFGLSLEVLFLFLLLGAAQMAVGYFWEPRLMGRSMNVSPVVVMFSLAVWTAIWGPTGAILSVILTSAVMTVMSLFPTTRPLAILLTNTGEAPVPVSPREPKKTRS
ncbi:Predicted PurR-regulated permease PerM [Shimia gijangensis]|uniref:Predicted PurR-regulated permease PerM n=1 Tax=Shimia gijangensis TaxID=1470563 RepID=A0A1M6BKX3_9RHOB|nr:AI-2E family transporter [Shimia gijangensis]SHI49364.1 Predicted PurR-regulated permease PerM [Shimia gijangensis]